MRDNTESAVAIASAVGRSVLSVLGAGGPVIDVRDRGVVWDGRAADAEPTSATPEETVPAAMAIAAAVAIGTVSTCAGACVSAEGCVATAVVDKSAEPGSTVSTMFSTSPRNVRAMMT
jgi:hypothetical protein